MKSAAAILALGVFFGSACCDLAFAQNSVGGPTRQPAIGGPVKQTSPVLPGNKAGSTATTPPSTVKCVKGSCAKARAFSVPIELERSSSFCFDAFSWTMNRGPLRRKTLWSTTDSGRFLQSAREPAPLTLV